MVVNQTDLTAIVAPPPTPNGNLHVGHLAGPYLGADVLRRYLALRERKSVTALSVDLHQTYVVTAAERLKVSAAELAARSRTEIAASLQASDIRFDVLGMPDEDYARYVGDWFGALAGAGYFYAKDCPTPFDPERGRYLFEAYASGYCPTCLAETKANICEACGHPNAAADLLFLQPTGGCPGSVFARQEQHLVFSLERWRGPLLDELQRHRELRPALSRLIAELFARDLPDFPITFPSSWGVPADFLGFPEHVLNVWAEMVPGHYYWLEQAYRKVGGGSPERLYAPQTSYIQFLGFDNSFFYAVAHVALALAARECGLPALLPDRFITNEFYELEGAKFSTSLGHVVSAAQALEACSADELRLFLAATNPETQRASFDRDALRSFLVNVRPQLEDLLRPAAELDPPVRTDAALDCPAAVALLARLTAAYDPRSFSLRVAAHTILNGLKLAHATTCARVGNAYGQVLQALAAGLAPLAPNIAQQLWRASGRPGAVVWPAVKEG